MTEHHAFCYAVFMSDELEEEFKKRFVKGEGSEDPAKEPERPREVDIEAEEQKGINYTD